MAQLCQTPYRLGKTVVPELLTVMSAAGLGKWIGHEWVIDNISSAEPLCLGLEWVIDNISSIEPSPTWPGVGHR